MKFETKGGKNNESKNNHFAISGGGWNTTANSNRFIALDSVWNLFGGGHFSHQARVTVRAGETPLTCYHIDFTNFFQGEKKMKKIHWFLVASMILLVSLIGALYSINTRDDINNLWSFYVLFICSSLFFYGYWRLKKTA